MAGQEISINQDELQNCNGNLKQLKAIWEGVAVPASKAIYLSKGRTADLITSCMEGSNECRDVLIEMLQNSIVRYEALGITFEEAQMQAQEYIGKLGS